MYYWDKTSIEVFMRCLYELPLLTLLKADLFRSGFLLSKYILIVIIEIKKSQLALLFNFGIIMV